MKHPKVASISTSLALLATTIAVSDAQARPQYGRQCRECHGTGGWVGVPQDLDDLVIDVLGDFTAEIPPGEFGDPDRGVGPLQGFEATPAGTFHLQVQIKDPLVVSIWKWSAELKRIEHTDPDFQFGDPDPSTWTDDQLTLVGAYEDGRGSSAIPTDETEWTIHRDFGLEMDYYTSADGAGHDWIGPVLLDLDVTVPGGVLPGWYDIEAAVAGRDTNGNGFYDDEHFYLHVVPEPATMLLAGAGLALMTIRRLRTRR